MKQHLLAICFAMCQTSWLSIAYHASQVLSFLVDLSDTYLHA